MASKDPQDDFFSKPPDLSGDKTHELGWGMLLTIITLIASIFVLSPRWLAGEVDKEMKSATYWVGEENSKQLISDTYAIYKDMMIDTGYQRHIKSITQMNYEVINGKPVGGLGMVDTMMSNIGESILIITLQSIYRTQIIIYWVVLMAPLILALAFTGLVQRKIKQFTFGWASANIFHLSTTTFAKIVPFASIVYLFFPIAITTLFPVVIMLSTGVLLYQALSNLQKVF